MLPEQAASYPRHPWLPRRLDLPTAVHQLLRCAPGPQHSEVQFCRVHLWPALRQVPQPEWATGTPAQEKLHQFIDTMLERMLGAGQPPWQVRLMMREVLQPTEACRELVEDYIRPHFAMLVAILDELTAGMLSQAELRRVGMSIVGQCFVYRAAGDVVSMLVPRDEIESLHTPKPLAQHITRYALAALGLGTPLALPLVRVTKDVIA